MKPFQNKIGLRDQEIKAKKIYTGNLNENVTDKDIYKLFELKTTEYLHQTSSVDLKMSEKAERNRDFKFVTVPEFVSNQLIEVNGVVENLF